MKKESAIFRLQGIDNYLKRQDDYSERDHDAIMMAIEALKEQATIDCYGHWIPIEERLPDNINLVMVTWENTNPESYYKCIKGKKFCGAGHYCNGKWFWESNICQDYLAEYGKCDWDEMDEAIKVIAWMPLPEPYEKEGEAE